MQLAIKKQKGLTVLSGTVVSFLRNNAGVIKGVCLESGEKLHAKAVILTTGTFLNGIIHMGDKTIAAGRVGEPPSVSLANDLRSFKLSMGRLKTGTPPRLDGRTINWQALEVQLGDENPEMFSEYSVKPNNRQVECRVTYTNNKIHELIKNNISKSAMYSGKLDAKGPRYCPSIEDKVMRFSDRERHQIFLEPEGLNDHTVYPNGISTSLPEEVQESIIKLMPRKRLIVPMVTTIDGKPNLVTRTPLVAPHSRPAISPTIIRPSVPIPTWAAAPIAVEASAIIDATERSISPEMINKAIANAIIAFSVKLNVASDRFQAFRK